jgi:hypothetical protein
VAIGKISGVMLQSNLDRQGVDLTVDTDLVFFDVANRRLAVNSTSASSTLTVNGNVSGTYFIGNISNSSNANIYLTATGTGIVVVSGSGALALPSGNTAQEPTGVPAGSIRYNNDANSPEYYNGNTWVQITTTVGYQTFTGNGTGNTYPLTQSTTTGGVLVSLNGVQQTPSTAYTVNNNSITFTEIPLSSDVIDIRYISSGQTAGLSFIGNSVPATSSSAGVPGQIAYDSNYVYICVATNTWIRSNTQTSF